MQKMKLTWGHKPDIPMLRSTNNSASLKKEASGEKSLRESKVQGRGRTFNIVTFRQLLAVHYIQTHYSRIMASYHKIFLCNLIYQILLFNKYTGWKYIIYLGLGDKNSICIILLLNYMFPQMLKNQKIQIHRLDFCIRVQLFKLF